MQAQPRWQWIPYLDISDVVSSDLWDGSCDPSNCYAWSRGDTVLLGGTQGPIGVLMDKAVFGGNLADYAWGYYVCKPAESTATSFSTSLTSNGEVHTFPVDNPPICPEHRYIWNNGTLRVGSDAWINITLSTPFGGSGQNKSTGEIGKFQVIFKQAVSAPSSSLLAGTTSASSPSTSSSLASSSNSTSVSTSAISSTNTTQTASSGSNTTPTGTLTTLVGAITHSSSSPLPTEQNALNASPMNTPGVVGGTIGGLCILTLIVFAFWYARRRQSRQLPLGSVASQWTEKEPTNRDGEWHDMESSAPYSALIPTAVTPTPTNLVQSPQVTQTQTLDPTISSPIVQRAVSAFSPALTVNPLPAYDTYMSAPLVTFRDVTALSAIQGDDEQDGSDDGLHAWAEAHRDFITPHLERRLRAHGYLPGDDPNALSAADWFSQYGVTRYELAGLQELYERR